MQHRRRAFQWPRLVLAVLVPIALAWSCHRVLTSLDVRAQGSQVVVVQSR